MYLPTLSLSLPLTLTQIKVKALPGKLRNTEAKVKELEAEMIVVGNNLKQKNKELKFISVSNQLGVTATEVLATILTLNQALKP